MRKPIPDKQASIGRSPHALFCPRCNSPDIHPYLGGMTGVYFCRNCGYMGTLVIEKGFVKSVGNHGVKALRKK